MGLVGRDAVRCFRMLLEIAKDRRKTTFIQAAIDIGVEFFLGDRAR